MPSPTCPTSRSSSRRPSPARRRRWSRSRSPPGVGWIYQYAVVDRSNRHDHAQLRALQDWFLKYELRAVPGVSEVASLGGMTKQYQVTVDPNRLRAYRLTLSQVR